MIETTIASLSRGSGVKTTTPFIRAELLQGDEEVVFLRQNLCSGVRSRSFIVDFSWSDGEVGGVWSDLGGRYSQEAGGLQLVDASVQDANAWKSYFDQVGCKLWERKGGKGDSSSLVLSHIPSLRLLLLLSSQTRFTPRGDCCNDTAELPKSRNTEETRPRPHESLNPANRLLLTTKHKTLQLPVSSRSQWMNWKERLLLIGICSDTNSRVTTQLPQDKYFYLTTKPEAVQL